MVKMAHGIELCFKKFSGHKPCHNAKIREMILKYRGRPFKNISCDKEHTNKIILIQKFLRIKTLFNVHLDNPLLSELNKSFPYFCLNSQRYPLFVLRISQSEERWSR